MTEQSLTVSRQRQLEEFETVCRKTGIRLTHQRLEIFREMVMATDHPSAETLHERLQQRIPTISLDTVYRTLTTFARYGLIHKVETVQSQGRYEVTLTPHHHLICCQCNEIIDFAWRNIDQIALPEAVRAWGRIEKRNVIVYGLCRKCLENRRITGG